MRRAYGMRAGRLTAQDDVPHERGARHRGRRSTATAAFNVDGETCRCEPAHFTLHDGGFDVVVEPS